MRILSEWLSKSGTVFGTWGLLLATAVAAELPTASVPLRSGEIMIDGKLDDTGWRGAARIEIDQPATNAKPEHLVSVATSALLTYDADYFYVGFQCVDQDIKPFGEKRDDDLYRGDAVEIFIDGTGDARQFFELQFNADNLAMDYNYLYTGTAVAFDDEGCYQNLREQWAWKEYDLATLKSAAVRNETGWAVEIAIPAKELLKRLPDQQLRAGMKLRANFVRMDYPEANKLQSAFWSAVPFGRPHRAIGKMGEITLAASPNE